MRDPQPLLDRTSNRLGDVLVPTPRQTQVLDLLAAGQSPKQIARSLWLTRETVASHLAALRDYFDVRTTRRIVAKARAWGFWSWPR